MVEGVFGNARVKDVAVRKQGGFGAWSSVYHFEFLHPVDKAFEERVLSDSGPVLMSREGITGAYMTEVSD